MDFKTATAAGQTFVYSDAGEGPLIALFHGFPDTPGGWAGTQQVLAGAGYRAVVPYLRGYHPDTIAPGRRYGAEQIGEDAILFLDAIGADSAILVGHDWGAAVVYRAAALAPDRVRAVCCVAIPHPNLLKPSLGAAWGARHFLTLRLPTGTWLARRANFEYEDALMRRWAPSWSGPDRDATLAGVKRAFSDPRVLDGALAYYRDFAPGGLAKLRPPGLVVGGTEDIVPVEAFRRSPEMFDGPCEVMIVEGAGHWPHREGVAAFHERLLSFLAGLTKP
jgi:pimeloyl-ACP methyl ester carboxylesterase